MLGARGSKTVFGVAHQIPPPQGDAGSLSVSTNPRGSSATGPEGRRHLHLTRRNGAAASRADPIAATWLTECARLRAWMEPILHWCWFSQGS